MISDDYLQYEPTTSKVYPLTPTSVLVFGGDLGNQGVLLGRIRKAISDMADSERDDLSHIVETYRRLVADYRVAKAEEEDQPAEGFQLGIETIIAGIDSRGARIWMVRDPQAAANYDHTGYVCIGVGAEPAERELMRVRYAPVSPLAHALVAVYCARRVAEDAPRVGQDVDIVIVTADGTKEPSGDLRQLLYQAYVEYQAREATARTQAYMDMQEYLKRAVLDGREQEKTEGRQEEG